MALKVLIVPDKFKGTLTARAAAEAMARGWRSARPLDTLELLPMCDGGDGFGEVMSELLAAKVQTARTIDAAHRPCTTRWWWVAERKLALIESARVIGLAMLPPGQGGIKRWTGPRAVPARSAQEEARVLGRPERPGAIGAAASRDGSRSGESDAALRVGQFHPFALDTFGLGLVLRAAAAKGARHCLVGIGGSATNDGGFGLARALGWQFLDHAGKPIEHWTGLAELARIHPPRRRRWFRTLTVAVDVRNPLLGQRGATRVYGPQKGLRADDVPRAELCLRRLARVVREHLQHDFAQLPGAGAAGGLGFGLLAFVGAELTAGFELFGREAGLEQRLRGADLVLTGEGAIDRQTLMGKGAGQIAQRCRELGIPCLGLAGRLEAGAATRRLFTRVHALSELTGLAQAKSQAGRWLERLAGQAASEWSR
jgi:glycerate 2-kinase